jgi:uncharacterized protein (DUF1330 family)
MKTRFIVSLAALAGFGLGATAIQGLHAQAKAPVYLVSEINVTDPDAYAKEFVSKAQALIKASGGRYVALGGVGGNAPGTITAIEGEAPKRVTVQVWDSVEKIKALRANPEYVSLRKVGEKYATFRSFAVDAVPE